jgi:hypothetical protein
MVRRLINDDPNVYLISVHGIIRTVENIEIIKPGEISPGYFYAHTDPHTLSRSRTALYTPPGQKTPHGATRGATATAQQLYNPPIMGGLLLYASVSL